MPTIPVFHLIRAWSSFSCRRSCGRSSSCASDYSDDPAARAVRPCAHVDAAVPDRCAGRALVPRSRHRSRACPARDRARAPHPARIVERAAGRAAQRRVAAATPAQHRHTAFRIAATGIEVVGRAARLRARCPSSAGLVFSVGAGDTVSRRRARAAVIARRRREDRRRRARLARRRAWTRLAAKFDRAARDRRSLALGGPQVRLARSRARCVREAHRQCAGPAALGGSLRAVRWRRGRARGGMARDHRRPRRGAPDPACAAGIAARSAPFSRRGARPRAEDRARAIRARSIGAEGGRRGGKATARSRRLDVHVRRSRAAMWAPTARRASSSRSLATRWWRTAVTSTCPRRGNARSASATERRCSSAWRWPRCSGSPDSSRSSWPSSTGRIIAATRARWWASPRSYSS